MAFRRTATRRPLRRALAPRRRQVRSVFSGQVILPAGEIDSIDLMGVVVNDPAGLTHVASWGLISVYPTVTTVVAATVMRHAWAARLDTTAVAALASAALLPLRDFTSAGANVADLSWRDRRYYNEQYLAGSTTPQAAMNPTRPIPSTQGVNFRTARLGTLDAGEGWYLYMRNSTVPGVSLTYQLDFQTIYLQS